MDGQELTKPVWMVKYVQPICGVFFFFFLKTDLVQQVHQRNQLLKEKNRIKKGSRRCQASWTVAKVLKVTMPHYVGKGATTCLVPWLCRCGASSTNFSAAKLTHVHGLRIAKLELDQSRAE